jgi:hypothetical protein
MERLMAAILALDSASAQETLDLQPVGLVVEVEHGQITLESRRLKGAFHS